MTETIFAGKEVEELSFRQALPGFASPHAVFSGLPEYFLVRNRPGHAGNWQRQKKKPDDLQVDGHFLILNMCYII
jgi:hypothetical protein